MTTPPHRRTVRSFVRREGRMTEGQRRALEQHGARYALTVADTPFDLDAVFGRTAPRILEIGFGMGESLLAVAQAHPETDYLGVEVYRPGVGHLMRRLHERNLDNVRIISEDAVTVLERMIPPRTLDAILIFFPDPWPKKRHHKRRLVDAGFVKLAADRLRPGGLLHLATDWADYATTMMAALEGEPGLRNTAGPNAYAERPAWRQPTRFERRGERLGHGVWDLVFERVEPDQG